MLKIKKNKRFQYTPRYASGNEPGNPYAFENRIVKNREQIHSNDLGAQWALARSGSRNRGNRGVNKTILFIVIVLVFLFLWIIDFDVSLLTSAHSSR